MLYKNEGPSWLLKWVTVAHMKFYKSPEIPSGWRIWIFFVYASQFDCNIVDVWLMWPFNLLLCIQTKVYQVRENCNGLFIQSKYFFIFRTNKLGISWLTFNCNFYWIFSKNKFKNWFIHLYWFFVISKNKSFSSKSFDII